MTNCRTAPAIPAAQISTVTLVEVLKHLGIPTQWDSHVGWRCDQGLLAHWDFFGLPRPRGDHDEVVLVPEEIVMNDILGDIENDVGSRPFYMMAQYLGVIPSGFLRITEGGSDKNGVFVTQEGPDGNFIQFFDETTVCTQLLDTFQQKWEDAVDESTMILLDPNL